ncbi:MAG: leucine-rich repeat protein [Bacteroidaceae bacterium]|nr:leucine-rich repeat protein [Bacteroidaceae bacterium]
MKKNLLKTITAMLLLFVATVNANAEIISGEFSPTLYWEVETQTGVLTISGTGRMPNFRANHPFISNFEYYDEETGNIAEDAVLIKKLIIEEGVTSLGAYAFSGALALEEVVISSSVLTSTKDAFFECTTVKKVTINEGVTTISDGMFYGFISLTEVHVPKSLETIGNQAFYNCPKLKEIHIKDLDSWCNVGKQYNSVCNITSLGINPETDIWEVNLGEPRDLILNGKKVTEFVLTPERGQGGYEGMYALAGISIESVEIRSGIIPEGYFYGCSKLKSVDISGTHVHDAAFEYCSGLTDLKIGYTTTFVAHGQNMPLPYGNAIGYHFRGCTSLKNIVLEDGVEILPDIFGPLHSRNGKQKVLELEGLAISPRLSRIDPCISFKKAYYKNESDWYHSFFGNVKHEIYIDNKPWQAPTGAVILPQVPFIMNGKISDDATSIKIPNSVRYIANGAFENTIWYKNQPDGFVYNENWLVGYKGTTPLSGDIEIKEGTTHCADIFDYTDITSVKFPEGLKKIETFEGCYNLESINIPNSVRDISIPIFTNCNNLKKIIVEKEDPNDFEDYFSPDFSQEEVCNNAILYVPVGCKEKYVASDIWNCFKYICEMGTSTIEGTYSDSIKWELNFDTNTLTLIGEGDVSTEIPWSAFYDDIDNIVIDENINILSSAPFVETNWYKGVPEGLLYIGNSLMGFKNIVDTTLTVIDVKEGTKYILEGAFRGNSKIERINAPASLKHIGAEAFSQCSSLTSITMENVETIGNRAFFGCSALEKITSLGNIKEIANSSFERATSLKKVIIPNSVDSIADSAFRNCSSLDTIIIASHKVKLGRLVFHKCDSIKAVYFLSDSIPEYSGTTSGRPFMTGGRSSKPRGTLYVPFGCKDKYSEDITKDFVEVVEMDMTELRQTTSIIAPTFNENSASVTVANGKITVSGCKAGETICIYSMNGRLLQKVTNSGEGISLDNGVYIVRVGNKAVKVKL